MWVFDCADGRHVFIARQFEGGEGHVPPLRSAAYNVFIAGHLSHSVDQILCIACIVYVASFDCTTSSWHNS